MMPTVDPQEGVQRLFAMLKSVGEFEQLEIRGVMQSLIQPSLHENCFIGIYLRAMTHFESLKRLDSSVHFQAISMLTRSLFELAVDIALLDVIPDSALKMLSFSEVEKLRCARKIVEFKKLNSTSGVDESAYASYIAAEGQRIDGIKKGLWPGMDRVDHWSGKKFPERVKCLGEPYKEIYQVQYPRLSWYVHSGLTGVMGLKKDTFVAMCGVAFKSSVDSFEMILLRVIKEFQLEKGNEKIKDKLKAAKLVPFTNSPEEAEKFFRQIIQ
jgi:phosphorylcholine metabolism protein LicD